MGHRNALEMKLLCHLTPEAQLMALDCWQRHTVPYCSTPCAKHRPALACLLSLPVGAVCQLSLSLSFSLVMQPIFVPNQREGG